jgi:hypothetical protein
MKIAQLAIEKKSNPDQKLVMRPKFKLSKFPSPSPDLDLQKELLDAANGGQDVEDNLVIDQTISDEQPSTADGDSEPLQNPFATPQERLFDQDLSTPLPQQTPLQQSQSQSRSQTQTQTQTQPEDSSQSILSQPTAHSQQLVPPNVGSAISAYISPALNSGQTILTNMNAVFMNPVIRDSNVNTQYPALPYAIMSQSPIQATTDLSTENTEQLQMMNMVSGCQFLAFFA